MRKFIQKMTFSLSYVGMFFLIPMMLLTTGEVVGRAIWSRPIPGSMELSSYMLAIFVLLGIAYTHQVGGQVRVTMLVSRIPEKAALVLQVLTTLLSLFIIGIMAWQGWVKAMEESTVSDMLRVPQFPFRMLVSVAGLFLFLELLLDLVDSVKKLIRS
ncbi:TRAP transporter, DctQ-like membrane protein [delta proteobacterium NaphS2]|nr:TRAP transporter, DctQ-like membrane protein [delta proteobacterium NaphS2]